MSKFEGSLGIICECRYCFSVTSATQLPHPNCTSELRQVTSLSVHYFTNKANILEDQSIKINQSFISESRVPCYVTVQQQKEKPRFTQDLKIFYRYLTKNKCKYIGHRSHTGNWISAYLTPEVEQLWNVAFSLLLLRTCGGRLQSRSTQLISMLVTNGLIKAVVFKSKNDTRNNARHQQKVQVD